MVWSWSTGLPGLALGLGPIMKLESDLYQALPGGGKKFKPYYVAHTKVQALALLDESQKASNWLQRRTLLQPIRSSGHITARIKILPVTQPHLYQRLRPKVVRLRALGMTYDQIAHALHIGRKTAIRAARNCPLLHPTPTSIHKKPPGHNTMGHGPHSQEHS